MGLNFKKLLTLPTDGKPVSSFTNKDDAWYEVYEGLKRVIDKELMIKQLKLKDEFKEFLQDTEMLTKAHSQKEKILLDDIFVYPDLNKFDELKNRIKVILANDKIPDNSEYPNNPMQKKEGYSVNPLKQNKANNPFNKSKSKRKKHQKHSDNNKVNKQNLSEDTNKLLEDIFLHPFSGISQRYKRLEDMSGTERFN